MGIAKQLKEFLDKEHVPYKQSRHETAYTAMEIAGAQHVPGKDFLKTVMVKADGKYVMCVLPAVQLIDFAKLKKLLNCKNLELTSETEIAELFPEFEVGAAPPFGHLKGIPVYSDKMLENDEIVFFNGGTHNDVIQMNYKDFIKLEHPKVADFGRHI